MNAFRLAGIALHALLLVQGASAQGNGDPESRAIFYAFLESREADDNIDLSFSYQQEHFPAMDCRLEVANGSRRLEIFAGNGVEREVTIVDGEHVWRFEAGSDLVRTDLKTADNNGWFCFDPRTLGMAGVPRMSHELRNQLVEGVERFELVGRQRKGQYALYELRAHRGGTIFEYAIEEPTMRLFEKTVKGASGVLRVALEYNYDWSGSEDWVPSRVVATREPDGYRSEFLNVVRGTDTVGPDRFTLKSLDLPIGTAVVDNVLHRRIGYWDGEEIVRAFPLAKLRADPSRSKTARYRWIAIALSSALLLAFAWVMRRRGAVPGR